MNISENEVRNVADLGNLSLTDAEVQCLQRDLSEILTHIEKLNELDTKDVQPMAQVLFQAEETASLREDLEHTPLGSQTALANAPQHGAGYFKVPKVIER